MKGVRNVESAEREEDDIASEGAAEREGVAEREGAAEWLRNAGAAVA